MGRALAKSCRSRSKLSWNIVGRGEAGRSNNVAGIVVTVPPLPFGMMRPARVTARMERMMAPGTRRATSTAASRMPPKQSSTPGEPKSPCVTKVAGLATTMPPFFRPMKAMKRPMPQVMANFSWWGMAAMIFSRTPVTERPRKMTPLTNTRPRADCHETPSPRQMVKAK
jgi:hypothetical protein